MNRFWTYMNICVLVWMYITHARLEPIEANRGLWILWNWNYLDDYGPSCVCWELNSCPLKEQKVFSLCSSGQPRTCYAAKAGHEFIEIDLLLTPESWDSRCAHHARIPANIFKALTHMSLFFSERLNSHSHITCHKDETLIGSRASWI